MADRLDRGMMAEMLFEIEKGVMPMFYFLGHEYSWKGERNVSVRVFEFECTDCAFGTGSIRPSQQIKSKR